MKSLKQSAKMRPSPVRTGNRTNSAVSPILAILGASVGKRHTSEFHLQYNHSATAELRKHPNFTFKSPAALQGVCGFFSMAATILCFSVAVVSEYGEGHSPGNVLALHRRLRCLGEHLDAVGACVTCRALCLGPMRAISGQCSTYLVF